MENRPEDEALGRLTPREREVLALLRLGLTNQEIAERLGMSADGAKYHVSEIIGKLGVRDRYEAASWPERRPWWTAALTPAVLLWRTTGALVPINLSSVAAATSVGLLATALGGIGLIAFLLVRSGNDAGSDPLLTNSRTQQELASNEDEPTRHIPTEAPATPMPFAMGDTGELRPGLFITVYSFEFPAEFESVLPDDVSAFAVVDVEGCAGSNPPQGVVGIEPIEFRIQRADEFHWHPTSITKEPALQETTLTPNECVRGYVTFLIEQEAEPAFVLFGGSVNLTWAIR